MKGKGIWFLGSLITLEPARRREPLGGAAGERQESGDSEQEVQAAGARASGTCE